MAGVIWGFHRDGKHWPFSDYQCYMTCSISQWLIGSFKDIRDMLLCTIFMPVSLAAYSPV